VSATNQPNGTQPGQTDDSVKLSHVVGISTPQDEHGLPAWRDASVSPASVAQGFEDDPSPGRSLLVVVVVLFAAVFVIAIGVTQLFHKVNEHLSAERNWTQVDPRLAEVSAGAKAYLSQFAVLDAAKGEYQIPIDVAIAGLLENPGVLARHPLAPPPPEPPKVLQCWKLADGGFQVAEEGSGVTVPAGAEVLPCPPGFGDGSGAVEGSGAQVANGSGAVDGSGDPAPVPAPAHP
jgi:hypothetical protein